jgi:transcriptional regulator with XRE-family HTH domain
MTIVARPPFAESLKRWRSRRNLSQLDLALDADVSARHIAFLETGRAKPSREMVLRLSERLQLPLRARNDLLEQAGFASAFPEAHLDSRTLEPVRSVMAHMLARHAPYPAMICDRHWGVVEANASAQALLAPLAGGETAINIVRLIIGNPVAREIILNWTDVAQDLASRLRLELKRSGGDPTLQALLTAAEIELRGVETRLDSPERAGPFIPVRIRSPHGILSLVSVLAEFGTPRDITVGDLRIELFFPCDAETEAHFQSAL